MTIITGENGSGKSIIIDAIREMFGHWYAELERPISRPGVPFEIGLTLKLDGKHMRLASTTIEPISHGDFMSFPVKVAEGSLPAPRWVVDFWRSNLATDSYSIEALSPQQHRHFLLKSLQGAHQNADVTLGEPLPCL